MKSATGVREKEAFHFPLAEAGLVDAVDTLDRAVGILEKRRPYLKLRLN